MRDSDPEIVVARKPGKSPGRDVARARDASPRVVDAHVRASSPAVAPRFLVKLELEQEQVADIYKQGFAERAEVWRQGAWRPLVTTQELRGMLHAPRRPTSSQRKSSPRSAPPPPPVGRPSIGVQLAQLARYQNPVIREKSDDTGLDSDLEDTLVRSSSAQLAPAATIEIVPARGSSSTHSSIPALSSGKSSVSSSQRKPHATGTGYLELALAALASMLLTLSAVRALELHRAGTLSTTVHAAQPEASAPEPAAPPKAAAPPVLAALSAGAAGTPAPVSPPAIRVVQLTDLPVLGAYSPLAAARVPEVAAPAASLAPPSRASSARQFSPTATVNLTRAPHALSNGPDRAALSQALARAARSAQSCGEGPEKAQVVVSYGPSGVPRSVRFGSAAPSRSLRGCVLGAMARAVIPPFAGEPVTVEKTLRW